MINKIGDKIKIIAIILLVFGVAFSIICGGWCIYANPSQSNAFAITVIVKVVAASIAVIISSFLMYGFGQLVENSDTIVEILKKENGVDEPEDMDF